MTDNIYILIVMSAAGIALLTASFILLQVRGQNRLLQKQKQMSAAEIAHQKDLLNAVIASQEAERLRIGNDLHDEVGSVLSSLRMLIERNNGQKEADRDSSFGFQSKQIIDRAIKSVRQISHNLSPHMSGRFGFYDAVHELCDAVSSSGAIQIDLCFKEEDCPVNLNNNVAVAVYRVLAELVNNTIRHAGAGQIKISISMADDTMRVGYTDDGIGLSPSNKAKKKGMGLQNIESRLNMLGAKWQMGQEGARGFSISISIPVEKNNIWRQ